MTEGNFFMAMTSKNKIKHKKKNCCANHLFLSLINQKEKLCSVGMSMDFEAQKCKIRFHPLPKRITKFLLTFDLQSNGRGCAHSPNES